MPQLSRAAGPLHPHPPQPPPQPPHAQPVQPPGQQPPLTQSSGGSLSSLSQPGGHAGVGVGSGVREESKKGKKRKRGGGQGGGRGKGFVEADLSIKERSPDSRPYFGNQFKLKNRSKSCTFTSHYNTLHIHTCTCTYLSHEHVCTYNIRYTHMPQHRAFYFGHIILILI
jgi:hypothetical protein